MLFRSRVRPKQTYERFSHPASVYTRPIDLCIDVPLQRMREIDVPGTRKDHQRRSCLDSDLGYMNYRMLQII